MLPYCDFKMHQLDRKPHRVFCIKNPLELLICAQTIVHHTANIHESKWAAIELR